MTDLDEGHQTQSTTKSTVNVCINGLLILKAGESTTSSVYEYVADDDDVLKAYRLIHIIELNAISVIFLAMDTTFIVSLNIIIGLHLKHKK